MEDVWAPLNLRDEYGLPQEWANKGKGGCDITEEGDGVLLDAFTGPAPGAAGDAADGVCPADHAGKAVDTDVHWSQRYNHVGDPAKVPTAVTDAIAASARIINLHHGNDLLPHIDYPFLYAEEMKIRAQCPRSRPENEVLLHHSRD